MDLSKDDRIFLFEEIILWNKKIATIYPTSDTIGYRKAFEKRDFEINQFMYLPQMEEMSFHSKDNYVEALPNNLYKLVLYANGKFASVRMPYELPGFRYDPKI